MEVLVAQPDVTALAKTEAGIVEKVTSLVVDSTESLQACERLGTDIGAAIKVVEDELNPGIAKAHETHKLLTTQRKKFLDPLEAAKRHGKAKGAAYRRRLEDERREEEERLRAKARKDEEERRLVEAEQLAKEGHAEAADEVLEQPVVPPPVVVAPTAPPPPPRMYIEKWTARIDDPDLVPRKWCDPAQVRLNQHARNLKKQAVGTVPGVTFYDASGL